MHRDAGGIRWWLHQEPPTRTDHTLLFLHGFAGTGADWAPTIAALPPPWRGVAVDLPGHGQTSLPAIVDFPLMVDALDALVWNLGAPLTIVGYSFGARLALAYACRDPHRVTRLVLESVHPGLTGTAERSFRHAQDESDANLLERDGLDAFLNVWHQRAPFATRRNKPGWAEEVARKRASNDARSLARMLRGLGLGAQADLFAPAARIDAPLLLVAGERDAAYATQARRLHAQRPDRRVLALHPAGHNVHTEEPLAFQRSLLAFLATPPPSPPRPQP